MNNIELKPCPFCGETDKVYLRKILDETGYWVECITCRTQQGIRTRDKAINAWNSRNVETQKYSID